jgi:hypothetical protein
VSEAAGRDQKGARGLGENGKKVLIGRQSIMDYVGIQSPSVFYDFVKKGMPARVINKRWYAHVDNVSDFFRVSTRVPDGNLDQEAD